MNIVDAAGGDVGTYKILLPVRVPGSDVVEIIEFSVTVTYCQVLELEPTPIANITVFAFKDPINITATAFNQVPSCDYELLNQWRLVVPEQGTLNALPLIFNTTDLTVFVASEEPLKEAGVYQLRLK